MQLSLFLFLAGSAISTAAQDMPMMLAGRGVAGIGAAGLLAVRVLARGRVQIAHNPAGRPDHPHRLRLAQQRQLATGDHVHPLYDWLLSWPIHRW